MSLEICRLCLSEYNLLPIFVDEEQSANYSTVLLLTTGLKIEVNDGLPQKICKNCTDAVNSALILRNTSQNSERELLNRFKNDSEAILIKNIDEEIQNDSLVNDHENSYEEINNDCNDIPKLNVEVTFDRVTQDGGSKCPNKTSRKDRRQMYLDLVEGDVRPGQVKCRVCRQSVSNWKCFVSHAKLHLGFNFVCEFCGKSFISSTQLKRHCRSFHGMERELACPQCSYLALDSAQLKLHIRRMHTGERPFICAHCASAFHSRKAILQHLDSHATTADVQCPSCSRSFKSRRQLARHKYSAHRGTSYAQRT